MCMNTQPCFCKTFYLLPLLFFIVAGCAGPKVLLCGGRVHNASGTELHDLRIVHQPTGKMLTANLVLAGHGVELDFDDRELRATSATVEWNDAASGRQQADVPLPRRAVSAGPQRLVYDIRADGKVAVRLTPCP